ncbi:MAG: P-loop NTPase fold protein [Clostridia bacterium]
MNWDKIKGHISVSCEEANKETYIFYNQYIRIKKLFKEFNQSGLESNKVISIVGERGSGKSSLIYTTKNFLNENKYFTIGPIDPSALGDSLKIIELILGNIYTIIENEKSKILQNNHLEQHCRNLHDSLKKTLSVLNNIRLEQYATENETAIVLKEYASRAGFEKIFKETIKKFEEFLKVLDPDENYVGIAVLIDDLDLVNNKVLYDMTEDIRKYLSSSVVVVLAYRESQLHNAIVNKILEDNEKLLQNKFLTESEISSQASRYLQKLMPYTNKVALPTETELYQMKMYTLMENLEVTDEDKNALTGSVELWIYKELAKAIRINIKPIDAREKTKDLLPINLREILELIKLIYDDLEGVFKKDVVLDYHYTTNAILRNISKYKAYLTSYSYNVLSEKNFAIINEWSLSRTESKNFNIYFNIWKTYFSDIELEEVFEDALDIHKIQPQNVAIADVYILIEELKLIKNDENLSHFAHTIKTYYSLELLELYLKAHSKQLRVFEFGLENDSLEEYLTLLNSYVIPHYVIDEIKNQYPRIELAFEYKYAKHEKYIANNLFDEIVNKLCYTVLARDGDLIKGARKHIKGNDFSMIQKAYRHRDMYTFDDIIDECTKGYKYSYDVFAFLGKKEYVKETISNKDGYSFVLISMFDIDAISAANYARRSSYDPFKYFLGRIDALLTRNNKQKTVGLSDPIWYNEDEEDLKNQLEKILFDEKNVEDKKNKFKPYFATSKLIEIDFEAFDLGGKKYNEQVKQNNFESNYKNFISNNPKIKVIEYVEKYYENISKIPLTDEMEQVIEIIKKNNGPISKTHRELLIDIIDREVNNMVQPT